LVGLEPGHCVLDMPVRPGLCQQNGFVHAGATTAIADTAAGYAAFSLMTAEADVLTVEFKMNLLNPAEGETLVARAQVIKPGRTLVVVRADVFGVTGGGEKPVATMLATMMSLSRDGISP
ncbi:MAG: PaaI family thioesterase, partial [Magnetospirillum sp.]